MNNKHRIGLALITNKISDDLMSAKTTLPALFVLAGAPMYLISMLVPIRESGALLPQAVFAAYFAHVENRHVIWRTGSILQLLSSAILLFSGFYMQGIVAGFTMILALIILSVSRALCSLTMKDTQGEHIIKGQRGKLIGAASSLSSICSGLVAFFALYIQAQNNDDMAVQKLMLIGGLSLLFQLACLLVMWPLKTHIKTQTALRKTGVKLSAIHSVLNKDIWRFIAMRGMLSHSALVAPLFTLAYKGSVISILAYLIVAQSFAAMLSSFVWGKLADTSALIVMRLGAFISIFACFILLISQFYNSVLLTEKYFICLLFFLLGVGHCGIRTGRKTYAIDIADKHDRTQFVAYTNTAVGIIMAVAGVLYTAISIFDSNVTLLIMSVGLCVGAGLSYIVKPEK